MSIVKNKQISVVSTFDFNNNKLTNLSSPSLPSDAVNLSYLNNYVALSGGTMNGNLVFNGSVIQFTDSNTEIWEDGANNLTFKDAIAGTFTLSDLSNLDLSGDISASGTLDNTINTTLNVSAISGKTELVTGLESTDEILVNDAGTLKRMNVSVLSEILGGASVSNASENYLLISNGSNTGITAISGLIYENNALTLNNISETYASGITLTNSSITYIELASTGITDTISIEYRAQRSNDLMKGYIEIIYDVSGDTLYIDDSEYSITNDIGLTFDADISSGIIRLEVNVSDNINDVDFKYIRKIIK